MAGDTFGASPTRQAGARRLRVSIVCYASPEQPLRKTLETLLHACQHCLARQLLRGVEIVLIDNGPPASERRKIERLIAAAPAVAGVQLRHCGSGENLGFGAGHNLAIDAAASEFHLILNPDVELTPASLCAAIEFMDAHGDCGMLAPAVVNGRGQREYLCKRYPSVFDLLLRGFAPRWLRARFQRRLARYEMRDVTGDRVHWQPPLISGCFMLARTAVLARLEGFDPGYFLYFEDYDLSLRAGAVTRIAYVPGVQVVHHGGHTARKGWRHIALFVRSALTFFNRHGWKWC